MFRVEGGLDGVHHGKILLRSFPQEIRPLRNADAVLTRGYAAVGIRLGVGLLHVVVQLALPCLLVAAVTHYAQMHVAVTRMTERDHTHARGRFQLVDIANEIRRVADGHDNVHRLLLGHGLDRHDERTAHLPDVRRLLGTAEHDIVDGAVVERKAAHALDARIDLALVTVKRQQDI